MTERTAYVGLGANLGELEAVLEAAFVSMTRLAGTRCHRRSGWYSSAPVDSSGPRYLNAVAAFETTLDARALLHELQRIEVEHGRERPYRNAPRTLDLDLLLLGNEVISTSDLTVPHPRMHERAFVLLPLAELAPKATIPLCGDVRSLLPSVAGQDVRAERETP
jgi:2-amino-4-hydroxy-6-hydroxymethyldihydropteridine diphosphokinase